jgi:hypothetical protein
MTCAFLRRFHRAAGFVPAIYVFCETRKLKGVDAEHKVGDGEK